MNILLYIIKLNKINDNNCDSKVLSGNKISNSVIVSFNVIASFETICSSDKLTEQVGMSYSIFEI